MDKFLKLIIYRFRMYGYFPLNMPKLFQTVMGISLHVLLNAAKTF